MKFVKQFPKLTERRVELLSDLFDNISHRFIEAPASTRTAHHHAYPGGLVQHIDEIVDYAIPMVDAIGDDDKKPTIEEIVTVAILHDLGKVGDACGNPQYVPNILKSGKQSDSIPYKIDKEYCRKITTGIPEFDKLFTFADFTDGEASIALIAELAPELLLELNESEINAVLYHDGGFGKAKYAPGYRGKEDVLAIIIHAADMLSSRKRNFKKETK